MLLAVLPLSAGADEPPMSRSGNVLFRLPDGWQRKEAADFTAIFPPQAAKWFEIRLMPGAEWEGKLRDGLETHVQMLSKGRKVLGRTDVVEARNASGFDFASVAIVLELAPGDNRWWAVWLARAGKRVQPVYVVANDAKEFETHFKTADVFLNSLRFANLNVIAAGDPPLTQFMVEETTDFVEWLMDVPFTTEQRQVFRDSLIESWKTKDKAGIEGVANVMKARNELATLTPEKRDFVRKSLAPQLVDGWRKENDKAAKMLVDLYDSARKPIAAGEPPLTRPAADAALELLYFMAGQLENSPGVAPTAGEKDEWAKRLSENFAKFPEDQRKQLTAMPLMWAAVRAAWPELPATERDKLKAAFKDLEPVKAIAANIAKAKADKATTFAEAMRQAQQSHQNYMMLSNVSAMMHRTNMAIISNIGGNTTYRYEYRYRPR